MAGEGEPAVSAPPPAESSPPLLEAVGGRTYYLTVGMRPVTGDIAEENLERVSKQFAIKGLLFTVVGVVAILFPLFFGLAMEQLLAWLLTLGGGVTLVQFLLVFGAPGSASFLLLGALHLSVGVWLLVKPIEGLEALTFVLSGWFLVHGILKLVMAFQVRRLRTWPAVLVSGIISIALGLSIIALTPLYGRQLVGIVFGADLLATGVAMLLIALMAFFGRGHRAVLDSEAAQEPLLQNQNRPAAASA